MNFSKLETILLDGDGVLWQGQEGHPNLLVFFETLHKYKIQWALLTNNNTHPAVAYVEKLNNFGIPATAGSVYTSSTATIDYLNQKYGQGARIHVVGMPGLITALSNAGFQISYGESTPDHPPQAVVAGMDREITHDKIKIAMRLIMNGAEFIATNTDGSFPAPDGINPGTGMVIGALQATSATTPTVIGKPQAAIFNSALAHLNATPETTAMVGDRLETDILGAQRLGIHTLLVLSGVTTREMLTSATIQPDHIFNDIGEIANAISQSRTQ